MAGFVELTLIEIHGMRVISPVIINFANVKYFRGFDEGEFSLTRIVFKDISDDDDGDVFVQENLETVLFKVKEKEVGHGH
tara:strand:+ start:1009 stop:1248 length:240 start_codon:yes stop_codon:yes gene_type:complete